MIQVNELMIGNKIYCDDLDIETGKWHQKIIDVGYRDIYNLINGNEIVKSAYEPIPLTEEWLIKFGFVSSMFEDNVFIHYNGMKYFLETQQLHFLTIELNCKYVHILQNIYFALTGEELTIKTEL